MVQIREIKNKSKTDDDFLHTNPRKSLIRTRGKSTYSRIRGKISNFPPFVWKNKRHKIENPKHPIEQNKGRVFSLETFFLVSMLIELFTLYSYSYLLCSRFSPTRHRILTIVNNSFINVETLKIAYFSKRSIQPSCVW